MPSHLRTFAAIALALALLPACGQAVAGKAAAQVAADVVVVEDFALVDVPAADAVKDAQEVAADAQALPVDVSEGTVTVHTSYSTLIPPPLAVDVTASVAGVEVTQDCAWTASPPEVCALVSAHAVRKVGDGTCAVTCTLAGGASGSTTLVATRQSVLYEFGGTTADYAMAPRVLRFRVNDNEWDDYVAPLPYPVLPGPPPANFLRGPTAIDADGSILLIGGVQKVSPEYSGSPPYPADYCPGVDAVTADKQWGCGLIWRFELTTGAWSLVGKLAANRNRATALKLGSTAYLVGGQAGDPEGLLTPYAFKIGLPEGTFAALPAKPPVAVNGDGPSLVPWKGGVVALYATATWWIRPDGELEQIDLGLPTGTEQTAFKVPGVDADIFVAAPVGPTAAPCASSDNQPALSSIAFWRLDAGKWTSTANLCVYSGLQHVVGPDAVYMAPDWAVDPTWPKASVRRLAAPGDKWEELAPVTHWRTDFAAVVVEQ